MLWPDSQPLTRFEMGHVLRSGIVAAAGKQLHMADKHATDFQAFLSQKFHPGSKGGTSGVFYEEFGDKVRAAIKDPSSADKNLRYYVKNNFQLLNLPSLGARDVLVVPAKEQVIFANS